MNRFLLLFFLASTSLFSANSFSAIQNWELDNVLLSDGQSLSGGFSFDTDTNNVFDVNFENSGTALIPATSFVEKRQIGFFGTLLDGCIIGPDYSCSFVQATTAIGDHFLNLGWGGDIGDPLVESLPLLSAGFGLCADLQCSTQLGFTSPTLVSGSIELTSVPLPAGAWLFGSAVLSLVGIRKYKK